MATIRVQNIATGQTGTMEDWDYNPQQFKRLDQQTPSQPQKGGGGILPIAGSILGSLLGTPFGPAGIIGGGAIGGGLGAAAGGDDIVKEAGLGGLGGAFGLGLGRVTGPILGKVLGRGAQPAAQAAGQATGQAATRPGSSLAAKTLASNFIVPTKIGREGLNIEDALSKMLQDRVKIPNTLGGYQKIAQTVTGDEGFITKATRTVANKARTPINYDQALTDAQDFANLQGEIAPDTLERIRNHFIARKPVSPGYISATDALDVSRQLEKQGFDLIKRYGAKSLSPNLALENKGHTFIGVADDLKIQISRAGDMEGLFGLVREEAERAAAKLSPQLAQRVAQARNLTELRSIAAPYVNISRAYDFTRAAQQAPFNKGGEQLALRLGGAGAGFGIGNIPGAIAGAALAPAAAGVAQAAQPALTGLGAKGILGGAQLAGKAGPLTTQTIGQIGARNLVPTEVQAQEPIEGQVLEQNGNVGIGQQPRNITDVLKLMALLDLDKGGKNINKIIALSNFLSPPVGAATRTQLQQIEGAQALTDQLESRFNQAVQAGEFGGFGKGPLSTIAGRISGGRLAQNALLYDNAREGFTALIARSTGERGVLTDADAERAKKLIPTANMDPATAAKQFAEIRKIFADAQARIGGQQEFNFPFPQEGLPAGL